MGFRVFRPETRMETHVVILAAGKGTRMKSARAKVLHRVAGLPMIEHVIRTARALDPATITVVVGHQRDTVRAALARHADLAYVDQEPQLGTAHALSQAEPVLRSRAGAVVLLSGDVPLLSATTLRSLLDRHVATGAAASLVTAVLEHPQGYGRIVRSGKQLARVVEEKDATEAERSIREINAGIYAFALDGLFASIAGIGAENAQGEYYLPDLVGIYRGRGLGVETVTVDCPDEVEGINSRAELAKVSRAMRQAKNDALMAAGVTIEDPSTTYVDRDVVVGPDTILHPGVSLEGATVVGTGCEIHSGSRIVNSHLGDRVVIYNHCVVTDTVLEDDASAGPFAHLRQHASVGLGARVGNFVELKNTRLGPKSKSMHLAYLGDAVIGTSVNVGAGTITCNYDGVNKHRTTIEDGAFIGSDTQLVAPVTVGAGAYVGTGTTVREDVPGGSLAVSAGKQRNIEGWVAAKQRRKANP